MYEMRATQSVVKPEVNNQVFNAGPYPSRSVGSEPDMIGADNAELGLVVAQQPEGAVRSMRCSVDPGGDPPLHGRHLLGILPRIGSIQ